MTTMDGGCDCENSSDSDDFIQWLCWMWAQDGERFYPPDETAEECTENLTDESRMISGSGLMITTSRSTGRGSKTKTERLWTV